MSTPKLISWHSAAMCWIGSSSMDNGGALSMSILWDMSFIVRQADVGSEL